MWKSIPDKLIRRANVKYVKNGKWKEFNRRAELVAEGHYCQDLKHGIWREYYETGELLIQEMYDHGVLHGPYCSYHANGNVMGKGQYIHGSREGYFKFYDSTGQLIKTTFFVNNVEREEADEQKNSVYVEQRKWA